MTDETLFSDALAIPDPVARQAFLERSCPDAAQRQRVAELLAAVGGTNPLDRPPADLGKTGAYTPETVDREPTAAVGDRVGPYKLLEKIGEGGMGEVWVADQLEPIKRRVALKLIKPGMDSRSVLGRFEAERQALAVMDHPSIAKVLDAGTTADGRPYFVMELVKGTPITEFCDARKLTPKQRLELFVPVCQAIQHAHMKGIIHRDIKPSNVLVALHDETPVPKVIDFGVAKAVGQQLTEKSIYTGFGALVGTPAYMAPEQATFNQLDVDTRADVYALGVLLYELLAGSPPIEKERLKLAALDEVLRIVRDEEPPRPSQRLSTSQAKAGIAASRQSDPARLSALMKGEIDWIVMKALEKDRARRYETANGLAKDIQRYLAGDAVEACPPTLGYRLRKAYRRNKAAVLTGGLIAAVLLAATVVSVAFGVKATRAEAEALAARDDADGQRALAVRAGEEATGERDKTKIAFAQLQEQQRQQRAEQYSWDMQSLPSVWEAGNVGQARYLLDRYPPELRGFEWHYWNNQTRGERSTYRLPDTKSLARGVQFSQDGSRVAKVTSVWSSPGGSAGPTATVWDAVTRKTLLTHEMTTEKIPPREGTPTIGSGGTVVTTPSTFSADGRRLALTRDTRLIDPKTGITTRGPFAAHFQVVDVDSGKVILDHDDRKVEGFKIGRVVDVAFSPDGRKVAVARATGSPGGPNERPAAHVWNLDAGGPPVSIPCNGLVNSPFSPDGSRIVVRRRDGQAFQWVVCDSSTGKDVATSSHVNNWWPTYSPDGVRLAHLGTATAPNGGTDPAMTLHIWDAVAGKELHSLALPAGADGFAPGEFRSSARVSFSRDGSRLAVKGPTASGNDLLVLIDPVAGKRLAIVAAPLAPQRSGRRAVAEPVFSPDGKQLALATGNLVTIWDATTGRTRRTLTGHQQVVVSCSFTGSGQLRSVEQDGTLKEWDVRPTDPVAISLPRVGGVGTRQLVVSADGRLVATTPASTGRVKPLPDVPPDLQLWIVATKRATSLTPRAVPFGRSNRLAVSSNGQRLALLRVSLAGVSPLLQPDPQDTQAGDLTVWDTTSGKEVCHVTIPASELAAVSGFAISPDGSTVAIGTPVAEGKGDTVIRLYDVDSGREVGSLRGTDSLYRMLFFSPDGKRLAALGTPLIGVPGLPVPKGPAEVPPPKLAVWDVTSRDLAFTHDFERRGVGLSVAWSPDGTRLAVLKPLSDTLISIYDAATGKPLGVIENPNRGAMAGWDSANIAFSPDGRRLAGQMPARAGPPGVIVCLWDADSGKELLALRPDLDPVRNPGGSEAHVAFSADGHRLSHFQFLRYAGGADRGEKVQVTTWDASQVPEAKK